MADKFSNLSSAEKALRGIGAARSGAKKAPKPKPIVPKSALELQVNPNAGSAKVAAEPAVRTRAIEQAVDTASMGESAARVRALREHLHSLEGQDAFRSLPSEIQQGVIADAATEHPQWKAEFEAVRKADKGVAVPVQKIDDGSPADDVLQLGKDDPKIGEPSPGGIGDRKRQASPKITTEHARADGSREKVEYPTPEYEKRKYVDMDEPEKSRLNKGELPGDIRKALQSTGNLPRDGQKTSDLEDLLNHALSESKVRLESAIESSPEDAANIMADPIAHGGLFTAEEIQTLRQLEDMSPEDAKIQRLSIITQRQDIAHKVADRLRSEGGEGAPSPELMERARSWQGNQTIRKPGVLDRGSKSLLRLKPGFDMEPYDLSPEQNLRQIALGEGGGTATKGGEVVDKDGKLVEGETQSGFSSQSGRGQSRIGRLVSADQRGRLPVTHQVLTEDAADGTLKYPQEAFRTILEMASRLEENPNWYSVQSAIARVETYINKYRKSQGLPNLQWTPEMSRTLDAAIRKEGRVAGGATPASGSLEGRVAASKATDRALRELRTTLGTEARKLGVAPPVGGARQASDAPAMTETDPAGIVSPGTSQDASRLPPAAENVRGPDVKRATPAQRDLDTGDLVTRDMSPETAARHEQWSQLFSTAMSTGDYGPLTRWMSGEGAAKADAPVATEAPADGSLATPPAVLPVKKSRSRKKPVAEAPAPPPETPAPAAEAPAPAAPQPTKAAVESLPPLPKEEAPAAVASGDSEITAYVRKNGRTAAVKQFGEDAVNADGKLVGNQWVPNAKSEPVTKPVEPAAKPVEEAATPAVASELPADAPSLEKMQDLAEQWGVPYEGVSDLDLFNSLFKKSEELRKTHGEEPFSSGEVPPFTKRKMRNGPGDVAEGANQPGQLPEVPPELQQSVGELTTEVREPAPQQPGPAVARPGSGRMPSTSSSTAAKPAPEGQVTSSSGTPRVVHGAKEPDPVPPPVPPASTTHIPNIPSHRVKSSETKPKYEEEADWLKPYVDEDGNTARLPAADEDVVPFDGDFPEPKAKKPARGNLAVGAGLAAIGGAAAGGLGGAAVEHWGPVQTPAPEDAGWPDALDDKPAPRRPAPPAKAPQGAAAPPPPADEPTNDFPEFDDALSDVPAQPQPAAPVAAQAINPASGDAPMSADEVQRLSRALQSVSAARMYGYGQYGPAY